MTHVFVKPPPRIELLGMMNLEPLWNLKLFIESVSKLKDQMILEMISDERSSDLLMIDIA